MKKLLIAILCGFVFMMTACSADADKDETKQKEQEEQKEKEEQVSANQTELSEEAEELLESFPEDAEKVITTSVPITEMLQLLGVEPVGVPTSTNPLPEEFESIQQIGSPMAPDLEVITSLQADLILGAKSLESTLAESIKDMDLSAVYLPTDSYQDLITTFTVLGTYFDKQAEMNETLTALAEKEKELEEAGKGKDLPSVLLTIGTADSFMVMNEKSYIGSLIEKLGATNIAENLDAKDTYSPLNLEDIVVQDPDIILVLASGDHGASEEMFQKEVEKNEIWQQLSAYKNDNIHILDYEVFGVTSIKNAEKALTEIATYFYE